MKKMTFDNSKISGEDPANILFCEIEAKYKKGGTRSANFVIYNGQKIAGLLRKRFKKDVEPESVLIKSYKVVGRRNAESMLKILKSDNNLIT